MNALRQDLRYAVRQLLREPGFGLVVVLTLALGIGANTTVFSIVHGVLLRPLPFPEPHRLIGVFGVWEGKPTSVSPPNFLDAGASAGSVEELAGVESRRLTLTGSGDAVRLEGAAVSAGFFRVLGVQPALGRGFTREENEPGQTSVVVLSHPLWQQRFGGDASIVGRKITVDGAPYTVVGVMPPGFSYPGKSEAWMPLEYSAIFRDTNRGAWYLDVVGRLKQGVPVERARAEFESIGRELERRHPRHNAKLGLTVRRLHEATVGEVRYALLLLLGAVGFVLLIACVNVGNLLLARMSAREAEMAVRAALGASRRRLVRQVLTESVVLALFGGGLGLLAASWATDALVALQPRDVPRLAEVGMNPRVVAFGVALSVVAGLLFGSVPAWQLRRRGAEALNQGGRGLLTAPGALRVRGVLVAVEMALAVLLLVGAGLLMRSFLNLQHVDPGFKAAGSLTVRIGLPSSSYAEEPRIVGFFSELLDRVRALPGVQSAGAVVGLPLSGINLVLSYDVEGRPEARPGDEPSMQLRAATPGYFETMGIPLRQGRLFSEGDREGAPRVVILSESAARQVFPGEDPLGRRLRVGIRRPDGSAAGGTVVGVVGDVKELGLHEPYEPEIYLPHGQMPFEVMSVVVRTVLPPASLAAPVKEAVREIDPNIPVGRFQTVDQVVEDSISQPRFYLLLLAVFAGAALALAAIGIFGVISCSVARRRREMGIRLALGADGRTLVSLVIRQAMTLAGVGIGLLGAVALSSLLSSLLFDLSASDPLTFGVVALVLSVVALLAAYLPARRAAGGDPIVALRME